MCFPYHLYKLVGRPYCKIFSSSKNLLGIYLFIHLLFIHLELVSCIFIGSSWMMISASVRRPCSTLISFVVLLLLFLNHDLQVKKFQLFCFPLRYQEALFKADLGCCLFLFVFRIMKCQQEGNSKCHPSHQPRPFPPSFISCFIQRFST